MVDVHKFFPCEDPKLLQLSFKIIAASFDGLILLDLIIDRSGGPFSHFEAEILGPLRKCPS